jgi:hypothetical protein
MTHDCGLDLAARHDPDDGLPDRSAGDVGICSLQGVDVLERLGLQRTDGDGVGQVAARARGLVGSWMEAGR